MSLSSTSLSLSQSNHLEECILTSHLSELRDGLPISPSLTAVIQSIDEESLLNAFLTLTQMIIIPEITRDSSITSSSSSSTTSTTSTQVVSMTTAAFTINQLTRQIYSLYQRCLALLYSMLYAQRTMVNGEEVLEIPVRVVLTILLVGIVFYRL